MIRGNLFTVLPFGARFVTILYVKTKFLQGCKAIKDCDTYKLQRAKDGHT